MEKTFIVRPLHAWWITYKGKCIVPISEEKIQSLGWKFGEPVEIKIEDGKIIIEKRNKEDNNGKKI